MPRPVAPAAGATRQRQQNEGDDHDPEDHGDETGARMVAPLLGLLGGRDVPLRLPGRQAHLLDDLLGARLDPAGHVAGLEPGQDRVADDDAGDGVGEEDAGAIAGLDAHLMLVGRDQQDDAIVFAFPADLPRPPEPVAVILDRPPLEAGHGRDDELPARLRLERFRLAGEVENLLGPKQVRFVDDPAGQLGKGLRGRRRRQRKEREQHQQQLRHPRESGNPAFLPGRQRDPRFRGGNEAKVHSLGLSSR